MSKASNKDLCTTREKSKNKLNGICTVQSSQTGYGEKVTNFCMLRV